MRGVYLGTKQMRFNIIRHLCITPTLLLFSLTSALALEQTSIQLRWDHQFQFAGYYAAKWEGYYADAGFEVEIRSAITPDGRILKAVEEVAEGRADFGVGAADILIARDLGAPLVVLASIFQRSAAEFYAQEDTPLQSPRDLLNLRVARNVNDLIDIELQAMLLAEGVDPEKITPYPHRPSYKPFLEGLVDVVPGYRITIPYAFQKKGISYKTLRPINYGVDFYGDSLFSRQEIIGEDPEKVQRFIQATMKGWRFAMDNAIQVADRIARDHPRSFGATRDDFQEFNRFQIPGVKELMFYPIAEIGHTNPHRWRRMHDLMRRIGIVKKDLDIDNFIFDPDSLERERIARFSKKIKGTLIALTILTALILAWSLALRKTVAQKTMELRMVNKKLDQDNAALRRMESSLQRMVAERTSELEKAQAELLVKERLAVLGNLSGSISHEIRNPLGAIGASVYYLNIKLGAGNEKTRSHLARIQRNVDKATAIIESLLNLTRMKAPKTASYDLRRLIPEILRDAGIPETVEIDIHHPQDEIMADVDAAQLRIAVKNIVHNAVQAMQGAGALTARIRQPTPDRAEIVLSDTGPGIPPEHSDNVFQPLFTTKTHGIGFGLSIAKMIVEKHGGKIRAESPPGGGARFVMTFPPQQTCEVLKTSQVSKKGDRSND